MRFCPVCGTKFLAGEPFCPHDGTPTQEMPAGEVKDPHLGVVIDGRYRVEKRIGQGGMGVVYQATHTVLGKRLALKVLRNEMATDADTVTRFIQEAQSATSIGHENIIDISDFGRLPDGSVYFVMEYLDGEALTSLIKRGGSVPMKDAVHIIRQIASALGAAHARGIVHRDLKPDNVFLIKRGDNQRFVKVLDFGVAKVGGASSKLTKTGMVFGTPHYMAPEQAAGQTVDQRTDIYALGVIMYEMFVGKVPFDADTFMGILTKHMFEAPTPPSQVQGVAQRLGALEDITLKALQKKPEHRYQSMAELVDDLDRVAAGGASVQIGQPGIHPPDNLADALEPPSKTEMRLSGPTSGGTPAAASDVETAPKKSSSLPLILGGLVVLVVLGGGALAAGWYFLGGGGAVAGNGLTGTGVVAHPLGNGPHVTVPPIGNGTVPPIGNGTTPAVGNGTVPPVGNGTTPPVGNGTVPPIGNGTTPPVGNGTVPPQVETVQLATSPAGAEVYVDGALAGNTPLSLPRPASGERTLELRLAGYRTQRVLLSTATPATMSVSLARASGGHHGDHGQTTIGDVVDPWGT